MKRLVPIALAAWLLALALPLSARGTEEPVIKTAAIGNGITIHYVDEGHGLPIVFVHGSLSDGSYWSEQIPQFATHYRAIAYSRRYNYPNVNPARSGYSAVVDADDLAGLVRTLHLGKIVVVGHSYGAFAAIFFAVRHPDLTRALVLAEPPAVSLLAELPANQAAQGRAMLHDIDTRMVAPMKASFARGDRNQGVADFIDYVFANPHAWDDMPPADRADTLRDAHEWDVMMTTGTLFPPVSPAAIRRIRVPVLLLSGTRTYPFLSVIDAELARLLPDNQNVLIQGAGHQMWFQQPELCRDVVETFLRWALR